MRWSRPEVPFARLVQGIEHPAPDRKARGSNPRTGTPFGLSDNVFYFVEQLDAVDVDAYHYTVVFRPETIVPDIDLQTSGD